jgi:hypothetical protein
VAWDTVNNVGKTGDSANHTLRWVKDGTSAPPDGSPAITEVDATNAPGVYKLTLDATDCTCNVGTLAGKSATSGVVIIPITVTFEQLPTAAPGAIGGLPTTDGTKLNQTAVLTSAEHSLISGTDVPAGLTAQGYTTTRAGYLDTLNGIVAAIWNALTSGMATVGSVGKRIADYLDVAVSSRGTGTALDAAGVRSAVGLASANLDTQLAALPTTTVLNSRTLPTASYALQSSLDAHLPIAVKRNQPLSAFTFVMLDSTDHVTPKAGLTVTARRKLDTGAWALCTNAVTFDATAPVPTYMIDLAAADVNGAVVTLSFTASGADPLQITLLTQA